MIWTDIEVGHKDDTSWYLDGHSSESLENLSNSMPAASTVTPDGPVPISSDGSAVVEQLDNSPGEWLKDGLGAEHGPEPELLSFDQATYQ